MLFQKILKNSINNNDFFKIRKNQTRIDDNVRYIPNFPKTMKTCNNISSSIENSDYNDTFLSNNIIAQNYIGKYKDLILNKSDIVEQNYQNFSKYKNLKNYTEKIPLRNDKRFIFKKEGNRLYKSESNNNIIRNSFYLSQKIDKKEIPNYKVHYTNTNRYFDKKRTDITDNSILEKYNNKQGFVDYQNKIIEFQNENRKISEDKRNIKEMNLFNSRLNELNKINRENNFFKNLETQKLIGKKNSKLRYKFLLDEQMKHNLNDKLMNESLTYNDLIQNEVNIQPKSCTVDANIMHKNKIVEINPYKQRNYFLGKSQLKNNIILNPQKFYKLNKYFFPRNDINELNY